MRKSIRRSGAAAGDVHVPAVATAAKAAATDSNGCSSCTATEARSAASPDAATTWVMAITNSSSTWARGGSYITSSLDALHFDKPPREHVVHSYT